MFYNQKAVRERFFAFEAGVGSHPAESTRVLRSFMVLEMIDDVILLAFFCKTKGEKCDLHKNACFS